MVSLKGIIYRAEYVPYTKAENEKRTQIISHCTAEEYKKLSEQCPELEYYEEGGSYPALACKCTADEFSTDYVCYIYRFDEFSETIRAFIDVYDDRDKWILEGEGYVGIDVKLKITKNIKEIINMAEIINNQIAEITMCIDARVYDPIKSWQSFYNDNFYKGLMVKLNEQTEFRV